MIIEKYKQGQILGYVGICYPSNLITLIDYYSVYNPNDDTYKSYISPYCDTTLDGILKYNQNPWLEIDKAWSNVEWQNYRIFCGCGAMGNEGFLSMETLTGDLVWTMYFDQTNPLIKVEVIEDKLVATNEHSEIFLIINLDDITKIKVIDKDNSDEFKQFLAWKEKNK